MMTSDMAYSPLVAPPNRMLSELNHYFVGLYPALAVSRTRGGGSGGHWGLAGWD